MLCVRRSPFATPYQSSNRTIEEMATRCTSPTSARLQARPDAARSRLIERDNDDVGVEADHSSSKYLRSSTGIGGCSGRPSGRKSRRRTYRVSRHHAAKSKPSAYRLQQLAASEPADANLLAGKAELLRQAHRLAAAVLEDFGGASFGHLRASEMIDTNDIYHSETAAAMSAGLIRGLSAGRGLTEHYPNALSQGRPTSSDCNEAWRS